MGSPEPRVRGWEVIVVVADGAKRFVQGASYDRVTRTATAASLCSCPCGMDTARATQIGSARMGHTNPVRQPGRLSCGAYVARFFATASGQSRKIFRTGHRSSNVLVPTR